MKFSDILENAPDTLEASKSLPAGEYELVVIKAEVEELKFDFGDHKEGDENLMIYARPVAAIDVDEDELNEVEDWTNKIVSIRMFPEELGDRFCDVKSERGFVYNCGLNPADFENIEQMIVATVGCHFAGSIVHAPNKKNPDKPYVNLKQTAPL